MSRWDTTDVDPWLTCPNCGCEDAHFEKSYSETPPDYGLELVDIAVVCPDCGEQVSV